ncbi:hypothetical protein E1286_03740 [Nonomuraea terrae]|uniref:Transposase DDE domain-containing protein n=1 Tax=Nonomuraea terrae TaxID=2530383 RepID=A0A4R4ZBW3_9ACTN|nr:hypothetical protein E1286_03740 [Nonomuraea terrae]
MAAGKAYSSRGTAPTCANAGSKRSSRRRSTRRPTARSGSRGGRPITNDPDLYKQRNAAERCINRMKEWRGLAFRFDKTPGS